MEGVGGGEGGGLKLALKDPNQSSPLASILVKNILVWSIWGSSKSAMNHCRRISPMSWNYI